MLTLYMIPGCAYCGRVKAAAKELGITLTEKDRHEPAVAAELVARGGKRQVPYLVDEEANVGLYESEDIVDYLHKKFGTRH